MKYLRAYFSILLTFISIQAYSLEEVTYYEVRQKDTLGTILQNAGLTPLWGRKGFVQKTIELNAGKLDQNGNIVYTKTVLKIPRPANHDPAVLIEDTENSKSPSREISEVKAKESNDLMKAKLDFGAGVKYWQINSTEKDDGAKAKIESKPSPTIRFSLNHEWSESSATYIGAGISHVNFIQPGAKNIRNDSQNFAEIFIGHRFQFSNWAFTGEYKNSQRPYLLAKSNVDLTVESPWLSQLSFGLERKLIQKKNGWLSLGVTPYYLFSKELDSYKLDSGYGGRVSLKLHQQFRAFSLESSFFSDYSRQDSNLTEQTLQQNGIMFRILFPVGGEF